MNSSPSTLDTTTEMVSASHRRSFARGAVERLAREFGINGVTLTRIADLCAAIRDQDPEIISGDAVKEWSKAQREILRGFSEEKEGTVQINELLAIWVLSAIADEPLDWIEKDCHRLQLALTEGARRVFSDDAKRYAETLLAIQKFGFLQLALLASMISMAGKQAPVVHALPIPEYAPLMEQLQQQILESSKNGVEFALLLLNCASVGKVDSLWGFERGNAFRLRIAQRLKTEVLRPTDVLGQVGREDFACLLPNAGLGVAMLGAQRILDSLKVPISIGSEEIFTDSSVGIVSYPGHGDNAQLLMQRAKVASQAAMMESERLAIHSPEQELQRIRQRKLEKNLRNAIENDHLRLEFQPQMDLRTRIITGAEALLRWTDDELGTIGPGEAIAAAESCGMINDVTWWVINNAVRQNSELRRAGFTGKISINLSASTLLEPDLTDFIDRAVRTWNINPSNLIIEITESVMLGDRDRTLETLLRLKQLGVELSIDDFGTGFSSMGYLASLPLDELKIDISFVRNMTHSPQNAMIVQSLIDLAHGLGLRVVAEGVENSETFTALHALGCDMIQGYHISRALPASEFLRRFPST